MLQATPSKRRAILYPIFIVAAVAVVMVFSARREPQRAAALEETVTRWCEAAARGDDLRGELRTADPILTGRVADALVAACAPLSGDPTSLEVVVEPGFGPDAGETLEGREEGHFARIRIAGADRLGLRFIHVDGEPVIVGFSKPLR